MALKNNTWKLNQWYDQDVAGNVSYNTNVYQLWGWGKDHYGQLGQNSITSPARSSPVQIPGSTWKTLGMDGNNQYQMTANKTDGTLWVWGQNIHGALGLNEGHNTGNRSSPTQVPGTWSDAMWSGTGGVLAVKTDGTLWGWGVSNDGFRGDNLGPGNNKSSPVQIGSDTTWGTTIGKVGRSAAIKTDGTLWAWGGQEVHNNKTKRSSPVQVGSGTDWSTLKSVAYAGSAVKTDGTLWLWGTNSAGKLGQNNLTEYSSPIQIPGTWKDLVGGGVHSVNGYINTDNELWVMGDNEKGYLGQNNLTQYSSPVQVPGSWDQVGMTAYATMGIKTDGTAWVWGQTNEYGELGLNAGVNYSSPVQLPGTDWDKPTGGMLQMFALKKQ